MDSTPLFLRDWARSFGFGRISESQKSTLFIKVAPYQGKEGKRARGKVHGGGIVAWTGDIGAGRKFGGGLTRGVESV